MGGLRFWPIRILVAGGCGFIGSNYVCHVVREHPGVHVVVPDKLTHAGNPRNIADLPADRVQLVVGDTCDVPLANRLVAESDAVVNFAAESHNDNSITDPAPFLKANVEGAYVLIEACRRHGVRFHQVSTREVFGDLELDGPGRFTEASPRRPSSPYGSSKASADMLVRAWARTYGLRAAISICSNNYSPYRRVEKFIPCQVTSLIDGGSPVLYGDGFNVRDWIHVEDRCSAVCAILARGRVGETCLVGVDGECSNLSVVREILRAFGRGEDDFDWVRDRCGLGCRYVVDATKLRKEFGWESIHADFAAGLAKTIFWHRTNEPWWRSAKFKTVAGTGACHQVGRGRAPSH